MVWHSSLSPSPSRYVPLFTNPLARGSIILATGLAIWILARVIGAELERQHRREFLEAIRIGPTAEALASDSGLSVAIQTVISANVPIGSDTLAFLAWIQRIEPAPKVRRVGRLLGRAYANDSTRHFWVVFPERRRWYEFGICDWSRMIDVSIGSNGVVRRIRAGRIGACI